MSNRRPVSRLRSALPGIIIAACVIAWSLAWLAVPLAPEAHAGTLHAPRVASVSIAAPRAVALSDATFAPDFLHYVRAHGSITRTHQCGRSGYWTESSAYAWNGSALSAQAWNGVHDMTHWRAPYGGRVTFDGLTFRNRTSRPVLVAGWCA